MIRKIINKIIFKEKATSESYRKFLKKNCRYFGEHVYIVNPHKTTIDKDSLPFISIGNFCQIGSGVTILAHDESYSVCGLTHGHYPRTQKYTTVGDNVFIGLNSIILMGSNIGNNVIIGAGSVVCGNVESNSVYAGNPAKKVMTLDDYFDKHQKQFEDSAYIYFCEFYKLNKRKPKIDEMHVYRLLFDDFTPFGLNKSEEQNKNVEFYNGTRKKYKDIDDFLENYGKTK